MDKIGDQHPEQVQFEAQKFKNESSYRKFDSRTKAVDIAQGVDLSGKTAFVTGTNSGIGIETARTLCICGAHVVMANRNIAESNRLRDEILQEKPDAQIDILHLDLSSLQSVKTAADEFISKNWPLHLLILNAGVFAPSEKSTLDGFERAFGVNHLAHFYLTYLLLPTIRASAPARIVIVSSETHAHTFINTSLPTEQKLQQLIPANGSTTNFYRLYSYSKLCNVLMAMKLHRIEHMNHINVYVLHPGTLIATGIARSLGILSYIYTLMKPFTKTLQQGAATTIYCAISDQLNNESGMYYEDCCASESKLDVRLARDESLQDALWNKSLEFIEKFEQNAPKNQ